MQTHHIQFRDQALTCVEHQNEFFVAMKPIAEGMGLNWETQRRKLMTRAEQFEPCKLSVNIDFQCREFLFIPLRCFYRWLLSISPSKVKPEQRTKLADYQEECMRILGKRFVKSNAATTAHQAEIDKLTVNINGMIYTSSRILATKFNQSHDWVLAAIKKSIEAAGNINQADFAADNFKRVAIFNPVGHDQCEYLVTHSGFAILGDAFNECKDAMFWQKAFITALSHVSPQLAQTSMSVIH